MRARCLLSFSTLTKALALAAWLGVPGLDANALIAMLVAVALLGLDLLHRFPATLQAYCNVGPAALRLSQVLHVVVPGVLIYLLSRTAHPTDRLASFAFAAAAGAVYTALTAFGITSQYGLSWKEFAVYAAAYLVVVGAVLSAMTASSSSESSSESSTIFVAPR